MNKGILIGAVVVLAVAGIAYMSANSTPRNSQTASPVPQANEQQASPVPSVAPQVEKTIDVSGNEYGFIPDTIEIKAGEPTKIVFKNTGNLPHDLVVNELGAKTKVVGGGKEDAITVTAEKSGTYTFYCSVGNHRQLGMEGAVTVK